MCFVGRGHDEGLEMRRLKDNNISIVVLGLGRGRRSGTISQPSC